MLLDESISGNRFRCYGCANKLRQARGWLKYPGQMPAFVTQRLIPSVSVLCLKLLFCLTGCENINSN